MKKLKKQEALTLSGQMPRRKFLGYVAGTASAVTILAACDKNNDNNNGNGGVNLGSGDTGVLNYAYALEQLEAAFYTQVILTPYIGLSGSELSLLTDIRDHEIAHREFLKAALGAGAITNLEVDFSSVDFSSRASVLATAKTFEDLGVSAYNGAGQLLTTPDYLLVAGKIVSVEARHAAYIRDLVSYGSFADSTVVNSMGLDQVNAPSAVLMAAAPFIKTKLDASNLPTN